jgi:hypothetical protein
VCVNIDRKKKGLENSDNDCAEVKCVSVWWTEIGWVGGEVGMTLLFIN